MSRFQCFALLCVIVVSACKPPKTVVLFPRPAASLETTLRDRYAFLLIIDGGRLREIERLVEEGKLPTIKLLFFDRGAIYTHATTIYPTLSVPGHQAILTGIFPGSNGTPDLVWLDRANGHAVDYLTFTGYDRINSDFINRHIVYGRDETLSDTPHTLFHALGDAPTFASYELAFSGVSEFHPNSVVQEGWKALVEKRPEFLDLDAIGNTRTKWRTAAVFPRFTAVSCYGIDDVSHDVSPSGDRVLNLYQAIDRGLADLVETAKARGVFDKMNWVLTSDHGQHLTEKKEIHLADVFEKLGWSASDSNIMGDEEIHALSRDVGDAQIYLRSKKGWTEPASFDRIMSMTVRFPHGSAVARATRLVDALRKTPGVGHLVIRKSRQSLLIMSPDAQAEITSFEYGKETMIAYTPQGDRDPLGYLTAPSMRGKWTAGKFYSSRQWQDMSHESAHPDVLQALVQLYAGADAADILLITTPAYSVRGFKFSNHGSIERDDMQVPIMLSGPDIRPGRYRTARTVDIYPTLTTIFGVPRDPALDDGEPLKEALADFSLKVTPPNPLLSQEGGLRHALSEQYWDLTPLAKLAALEAFFTDHPDYDRVIDKAGFHRDLNAWLAESTISISRDDNAVLIALAAESSDLSRALARIDRWNAQVTAQSPRGRLAREKRRRLLRILDWEKEAISARLIQFTQIETYLRDTSAL